MRDNVSNGRGHTGSSWRQAIAVGGEVAPARPLIGVLPGEGVGPEIVDATLAVLRRLEEAGAPRVELEFGGPCGLEAERAQGVPLTEEVVSFCLDVFARGGAILNGPGGGRYVYDLRRRLGLFVKLTPIQARNGLMHCSPLRSDVAREVDLLIVRENLEGVYQGSSQQLRDGEGQRRVSHSFTHSEAVVRRFLSAAARLAAARRGHLTVAVKSAGLEAVSELWRELGQQAAAESDVELSVVDVDLIAYQLLERPRAFDVVAAPNMLGDILSDVASALVGLRSLAFGASFTPEGEAVYQTNHGSAHDIAGSDRANPLAQILSLAMLLRESLGLGREASAIERGIQLIGRDAFVTEDLARSGSTVIGTREMGLLVAEAAATELTRIPGRAVRVSAL